MNSLHEHTLLKQAAKGDQHAFCALMEAYYDMIYAVAFKWVGCREDAEDIAQDVCVKVGRCIRDFRGESQFSTWLYRIILNAAKDFQRKQRDHHSIDEVAPIALAGESGADVPAQNKQLWRLVSQLPEKQRDAVLLVYAQELTHSEVARVMECKESTVSWYIHEAKKQLKRVIGHDGR